MPTDAYCKHGYGKSHIVIDKLNDAIDFQARALQLRSYRQQLLASNIANADTPHYKAVDIDFAAALKNASGAKQPVAQPLATTAVGHLPGGGVIGGAPAGVQVQFRGAVQPSVDGNTVDMDVERAQFADNTVRYEAAVRFLNGQFRELMTAIKGE
jgi:flagellar basal-body rod protein FlgB